MQHTQVYYSPGVRTDLHPWKRCRFLPSTILTTAQKSTISPLIITSPSHTVEIRQQPGVFKQQANGGHFPYQL